MVDIKINDIERIGGLKHNSRRSFKSIALEFNLDEEYVRKCTDEYRKIIKSYHESEKSDARDIVLDQIDYIWAETYRTLEMIKSDLNERTQKSGNTINGFFTEDITVYNKKTVEIPKLLNTLSSLIDKRAKILKLFEDDDKNKFLRDKIVNFNYIAPPTPKDY